MLYEIEDMADVEMITRLIDFPRMTPDGIELLCNPTFPFTKKRDVAGYEGESVNWDKYSPPPNQVHRLGCLRQKAKQFAKPETDMLYAGYIHGNVGAIRGLRTARGHGFSLKHVPSEEEGQQHAEIYFAPNPDCPKLSPNDRAELREVLVKAFGSINAHSCEATNI